MKQTTYMMLKPDAFASGCTEQIKEVLRKNGYTIEAEKEVVVDMKVMQNLLLHYAEVIDRLGKDFNFPGKLFNSFYFDGPHKICPMKVSYEGDIITDSRELVGATVPVKAAKGTIRNMFADDDYARADEGNRLISNCIHASDSLESAERELAIWAEYLK